MAKTIKFNLICDDKPVRTIEDLQNNFSIEDVLEYYNNKLLHRWLDVRGYHSDLEKVSNITCENPLEIIKILIKIFNVDVDEKKVEESIYILEYLYERKELYSKYEEENHKVKNIINDYTAGYWKLVKDIWDNPDDIAKIKASIAEMVSNYDKILQFHHRRLFYVLKKKSKLAIMCLLMNEYLRPFYLPFERKNEEDGNITSDVEDVDAMYKEICSMITTNDFKAKLGDNLTSFSGKTDGYWKDLEPKGKNYMIISMGAGDFVRSAGKSRGDLAITDIRNNFMIVDGIDYKSDSSTRKLLYMEV